MYVRTLGGEENDFIWNTTPMHALVYVEHIPNLFIRPTFSSPCHVRKIDHFPS